jgi:hypothetical protein
MVANVAPIPFGFNVDGTVPISQEKMDHCRTPRVQGLVETVKMTILIDGGS